MSGKLCGIFGHREADPERDGELEGVLVKYINKGATDFVFCEVNKFSLQCLRILKRLKGRFNFIRSYFALTRNIELDTRIIKDFDFDSFFFDKDLNYNEQSLQELVQRCDFLLVQWFDSLHDKDEIVRFARRYHKPLLKF